MKVAVYYPWVYLTSGAERLLAEMTERSTHEWTVFTSRYEPENSFPELKQRRVVAMGRVSVRRDLRSVVGAAWQISRLKLPMEDFDALVVLCEGLGDMVTFRNAGKPALCICLTPLRPVYDPEYRRRALQNRGLIGRCALRTAGAAFRVMDRRAWRHYGRVVCVSEEIKNRVLRGKLAKEDTLQIAYPGCSFNPEISNRKFKPFFLLPGRIMWTKNIELGIRAFRTLCDRGSTPPFRLVIAGMVDQKSRKYVAELRKLAAGLPVEFRIAPSDSELAELYSTCYGVLFTAFNEDFGIVPVEAMAFAKPVIAVRKGGPAETIKHGEQGFLAEPNPENVASYMAQLVADPELAIRMGMAGRKTYGRYSWEQFTAHVDGALEQLPQEMGARVSQLKGARAV